MEVEKPPIEQKLQEAQAQKAKSRLSTATGSIRIALATMEKLPKEILAKKFPVEVEGNILSRAAVIEQIQATRSNLDAIQQIINDLPVINTEAKRPAKRPIPKAENDAAPVVTDAPTPAPRQKRASHRPDIIEPDEPLSEIPPVARKPARVLAQPARRKAPFVAPLTFSKTSSACGRSFGWTKSP